MILKHSLIVYFLFLSSSLNAVENDKNMVYGETGRLDTFDPYTVHESSGYRLTDLIFNSLVEVGPAGDYVPSLATSWEVSSDRTSVTFNLRKSVLWQSKNEKNNVTKHYLSADDVLTTVRLLKSSESEIPNQDRFSLIYTAEKISDHKVLIKLSRAHVDPLRYMTFKILPHHILGAVLSLKRSSSFTHNPIGTGPYRFMGTNAQGEVLLSAHEGFFAKKPEIKQVVMKAYSDQNVMSQSLMFNSLDLVTYVSPRDLNEILGDKKLSVVSYDALSFSFIAFNTSRGVLRDKRVRQALNYAINRKEMLDAFFQGKGVLISGPFPPTSWAYNLDVKSDPFDPVRARKLLKSAGLELRGKQLYSKTGKKIVLNFSVPLAGESEMIKRIVLAYQAYLADIGISLELQFMDWQVWKKKVLKQHDFDLTIASWSFDDASNISSLFHSSSAKEWGNNFVMYKNSEVDSLLTEANVTNDFDKKRAIYHKLHSILAEEAPYTYLWTLQHHAAYNDRLSGVRVEPFSFFKYVTSWNISSRKGR
ncbi:MAG: ABC transporter substrate-binding protein [Bdellovibrionota bacterium]